QGGPWGAQARGPASFSAPLFRTSQHRAAGADAAAVQRQPQAPPQPASAPPFYWVPTVDTVGEFEVGGACGEVVSKHGDYGDHDSAPPIAGTLRMSRGGLYLWTLQIVRQCPHRPQLQFGIHGANHSRPWRFVRIFEQVCLCSFGFASRLVSTGRCSRSRDDGPWLARPGGDLIIPRGGLRALRGGPARPGRQPGQFRVRRQRRPLRNRLRGHPAHAPLHPVVAMGGGGTCCRLCAG
ncbi:unnamed protein product, partial [Prorocentrum cordatum]